MPYHVSRLMTVKEKADRDIPWKHQVYLYLFTANTIDEANSYVGNKSGYRIRETQFNVPKK